MMMASLCGFAQMEFDYKGIDPSFKEKLIHMPDDELVLLGRHYTKISRPDSALLCYMTALSRELNKSNDENDLLLYTQCCLNISSLYFNYYLDYPLAYQYLIKAKDTAEKYNFANLLPFIYANLSNQLNMCESLHIGSRNKPISDESFQYLRKAIDIAVKQRNWKIILFAIINLSDMTFLNDRELLYDIIGEFQSLEEDPNSVYSKAVKNLTNAFAAYQENDFLNAEQNFRAFCKEYPDTAFGQEELTIQIRLYEALALSDQNKISDANLILRQIEAEADSSDNINVSMRFNDIMHSISHKAGRSEDADRFLLKYYLAKDQLAIRGNVDDVNDLKFKNELAQFDEELRNAKVRGKKHVLLLISVLIISVVLIAFLTISLIYSKKKRRYIMDLYKMNLSDMSQGAKETIPDATTNTDTPGKAENNASSDSTSDASSPELLDEDKAHQLLHKINEVMQTDVVYDPDFQLSRLCELTGSNARYIAFVINKHYGKTFKSLIMEIRINKARLILSDNSCDEKIDFICNQVGFKSRSAFSLAFKNVTGLSPSEFRNASRRYAAADGKD